MKGLPDYSDERHKAWCIYCGVSLTRVKSGLDHVSSKSQLDRPFPENLPTIRVCHSCNSSFSSNEEYFIAFLGSVLAGTVEPEDQVIDRAEKALRNNLCLQSQIEEQLRVEKDS